MRPLNYFEAREACPWEQAVLVVTAPTYCRRRPALYSDLAATEGRRGGLVVVDYDKHQAWRFDSAEELFEYLSRRQRYVVRLEPPPPKD